MKIGIIGGGVVGGGVVEILKRHPDIEIVYLVVKDVEKHRDFTIPSKCIVTSDIDALLNDDSVDTIVELMGGTDSAWDAIRTSLTRGRNVVTANKALISKNMHEIENILSLSIKRPFFLYEAAVCGGIPIINALLRSMRGDDILSIAGVMNGSTNWMLDRMEKTGDSYEQLLGEAKALGYLEADPSADILGWDARSKLCILARLGFGISLDEKQVACTGIDAVRSADMDFARARGKSIKLLASAWVRDGKVHAFVMPSLVEQSNALSRLEGAMNACYFEAKYSGSHTLIGSGAGRYPTANSVVSDILEISKLRDMQVAGGFEPFGVMERGLSFDPDFENRFYIRAKDGQAVEKIKRALTQQGVTFVEEAGVIQTEVSSYTRVKASLHDTSLYSAMLVVV